MFIVFEGIDGSGKETQMFELARHIRDKNKYQDVIITHEPWKSKEIKRKLKEDRDAYSDALKMAQLYVEDRANHSAEIESRLNDGYFIICDRYKMSTCAYQWTQGEELENLFALHDKFKIISPDLTFFIDVAADTAHQRRSIRNAEKEKFEELKFQRNLVYNYRKLVTSDYNKQFGVVVSINGIGNIDEVSTEIKKKFNPYYDQWVSLNL